MIPILDAPERHWQCPTCEQTHVTREARVHTPMHNCRRLNGIVAPFVEVTHGQELVRNSVRHRVLEWQDYVGNEIAQFDATGRAVSALLTERADGSNDCMAFAATAQATTD
jgi:hypothetical protein